MLIKDIYLSHGSWTSDFLQRSDGASIGGPCRTGTEQGSSKLVHRDENENDSYRFLTIVFEILLSFKAKQK